MKKWFLFFFLPLWLFGETVWKADLKSPFGLTIKFHPESMALGETLDVEADFQYPSSYEVDDQLFIDQLLWSANPLISQWTLIKSDTTPVEIQEEMKRKKINLKLAPLELGQLSFSFSVATFYSREKSDTTIEMMTPIFSIQVTPFIPSISLSPAPLIPLEPEFPLGLTEANRRLWMDNPQELEKAKKQIRDEIAAHSVPWITLAFLLGVVGVGWFLYLMRDRLPQRKIKEAPTLSLKQKLDQALKAIEMLSYRSEEAPLYYTHLSFLLHEGIEVRSNYPTKKMTTAELEKAIREYSLIPSDGMSEACSLLNEIDQVKYGGIKPSEAEAEKAKERVKEIISNCRF